MSPHITLWCDQDGVIAKYERHAYVGEDPLFLTPNIHYYRNLEPDQRIIQALQSLYEYGYQPKILTNLTDRYPVWMEHQADKREWTRQYLPFLNIDTDFYAIHVPKYQAAIQLLKRTLQPTDILISDFNNDLSGWTDAGGTAIKYLNGLNSAVSFDGVKLFEHMTSDDICACIQSLLWNREKQS